MCTLSCARLFRAAEPELMTAPRGSFRYADARWAFTQLPQDLKVLAERLCDGLSEPRLTYRYVRLVQGRAMGNLEWHKDGQRKEEEIHRLLCFGTEDTEGETQVLHRGWAWQYSGAYLHRPIPTQLPQTWRLLLRASQTAMETRNHWSETW